ncbi:hypothetical protein K437DRAFT_119639 [Tilletiaria anomala UBC 951]|uniref:Uncharacterized protein n=1 Tax=Tilletiaria anomala (strain ATCC 24038 / CBS 436.72 / UBC 951) TaxID=1037660 RepID=A0A066W4S1_TILAU|nr:uncharacterized protein K437DRAFT_119639 [Tilletiaria anomala UBC 951]KDN45765.1 hypothetical protein K437DRAFT_119639 [Tilletiaria anomala UBC 951]
MGPAPGTTAEGFFVREPLAQADVMNTTASININGTAIVDGIGNTPSDTVSGRDARAASIVPDATPERCTPSQVIDGHRISCGCPQESSISEGKCVPPRVLEIPSFSGNGQSLGPSASQTCSCAIAAGSYINQGHCYAATLCKVLQTTGRSAISTCTCPSGSSANSRGQCRATPSNGGGGSPLKCTPGQRPTASPKCDCQSPSMTNAAGLCTSSVPLGQCSNGEAIMTIVLGLPVPHCTCPPPSSTVTGTCTSKANGGGGAPTCTAGQNVGNPANPNCNCQTLSTTSANGQCTSTSNRGGGGSTPTCTPGQNVGDPNNPDCNCKNPSTTNDAGKCTSTNDKDPRPTACPPGSPVANPGGTTTCACAGLSMVNNGFCQGLLQQPCTAGQPIFGGPFACGCDAPLMSSNGVCTTSTNGVGGGTPSQCVPGSAPTATGNRQCTCAPGATPTGSTTTCGEGGGGVIPTPTCAAGVVPGL